MSSKVTKTLKVTQSLVHSTDLSVTSDRSTESVMGIIDNLKSVISDHWLFKALGGLRKAEPMVMMKKRC